MEEFNLPLVGVSFRVKKRVTRRMISDRLVTEAIECRLELEPDNQFDDQAIKVVLKTFLPELHIGYIGRPTNKPLFVGLNENLFKIKEPILLTELNYENGTGNVQAFTE